MTFPEFLDYIYQRYSGNVKLDLDRIIAILKEMHHPEKRLRGIHIGGTNGKGSTSAACEALALANGLTTGLNTSPHLIDYCERFRLNGADIDPASLMRIFHRWQPAFDLWDASFFEITTAIAFQLFFERQVHTSIIEVGLGGRLDATNLFQPQVSVVTTIGLDHTKTLGDTVELIAAEKAGIIKYHVPVVLGRIAPSPLQVILDQAARKHARPYLLDRDFHLAQVHNEPDGIQFDYTFKNHTFSNLKSNLLGRHQAANLALALTAFLLYCEKRHLIPSEASIRQAIKQVHWQGRMQLLHTAPTVIVDGAHNLQGMETLVQNLQEMFPSQKLLFIVSILADKDYPAMLQALAPLAKRFYISKNASDRAAEIADQTAITQACQIDTHSAPTVREAYLQALSAATSADVIIGCGSLYTVGEILQTPVTS